MTPTHHRFWQRERARKIPLSSTSPFTILLYCLNTTSTIAAAGTRSFLPFVEYSGLHFINLTSSIKSNCWLAVPHVISNLQAASTYIQGFLAPNKINLGASSNQAIKVLPATPQHTHLCTSPHLHLLSVNLPKSIPIPPSSHLDARSSHFQSKLHTFVL